MPDDSAPPAPATELPRLDRSAFRVTTFAAAERDVTQYWHERTPEERLLALEQMRQVVYGYDPATTRLQRILTVVQRAPG
jgi:hypothetical protein